MFIQQFLVLAMHLIQWSQRLLIFLPDSTNKLTRSVTTSFEESLGANGNVSVLQKRKFPFPSVAVLKVFSLMHISHSAITGSSLQCWDNSTRGLDSATALDFVRTLRLSTELSGSAAVVTLYQASQAIYDASSITIVPPLY
jgi:hypothetical protein